jgi:hypothetical protein
VSIFQRFITPLCGHGPEIAKLKSQLSNAEERADVALTRALESAHELRLVESDVRRHQPPNVPYAGILASLEAQRTFASQLLKSSIDLAEDQAESIEELTTANSKLMADIERIRNGEQLQLVTAPEPASDEERHALLEDMLVSDSTGEEVWRVVSVYFAGRHDKRWTLERDEERIEVPIVDREWLDKVRDRAQLFGAGDVLRVLMYTRSFISGGTGKAYTLREVKKVIAVIQPAEQIEMPIAAVTGGRA